MTLLTVFRLLASRIKTERSLLGKFTKKSYTFFTSQMRQALPINSYPGTAIWERIQITMTTH